MGHLAGAKPWGLASAAFAMLSGVGLLACTSLAGVKDYADGQSSDVGCTGVDGGQKAVTWVQSNYGEVDGGTTNQVAFNSPVTKGHLIIAAVAGTFGGATPTIRDNLGSSFQFLPSAAGYTSGYEPALLAYAIAPECGDDTVTSSLDGASGSSDLFVLEYSGIDANSPLDSHAETYSGPTNSLYASESVAASDGELALAFGISMSVGGPLLGPMGSTHGALPNAIVFDAIAGSTGFCDAGVCKMSASRSIGDAGALPWVMLVASFKAQ